MMPELHAPPSLVSNLVQIAARELRDAVRSRWFLMYTIAFTVLGLAVSYVSASSAGSAGLAGYGRTTAGLVNLVLLVVPLMSLTAGAGSIASDRERGMLAYILALPVARHELLLGKFVGLAGAMLGSLSLGLGVCAIVLSIRGVGAGAASVLWLAGLSFGLSLTMLATGLLISAAARRASVAVGTAIFLWLTLVFVTDLGLMAGAISLRLRVEELFGIALLNPLQVFKMWSLESIDASLDVLGPAGLYASDEYGPRLPMLFGGALALWVVVPLSAAALVLSRRSPL